MIAFSPRAHLAVNGRQPRAGSEDLRTGLAARTTQSLTAVRRGSDRVEDRIQMGKLTTVIVCVLLASSLVVPSVAVGHRTGSESERKAILRADGVYPRLPLKCNWVV